MSFFRLLAIIVLLFYSTLSWALIWELTRSANEEPLLRGEIFVDGKESVFEVSKRIFNENHISYSIGKFQMFEFIDGKNWPWCFYVKERFGAVDGLPNYLQNKVNPVNLRIRSLSDLIDDNHILIWCHCYDYP